MSDNSEENDYTTQQIRNLQKFIESSPLLKENRGVFAVAVCVGILLEVQEILYNKVAPFWQRLNRLDLDLYRVKEFYPEVKSKLAMYRERKWDTIINYLGTELAHLPTSPPNSNVLEAKENLNLVFSIGLAYGSRLKRGYLGERTKTQEVKM